MTSNNNPLLFQSYLLEIITSPTIIDLENILVEKLGN